MFNPFNMFSLRKIVGVDIGTSSIKVVEISRFGSSKTLENYGQIQSAALYKESPESKDQDNATLSNSFVAKAIRGILDEAGIKTKAAIFSIPDFSTFCTSFEIPPMTEKEIPDAIRYNASQYITLPISEVTLDWRIIPNQMADKNASLRVFLVAIPNQVVQEYQSVANMAGLTLHALEAESLGIVRTLVKNNVSARSAGLEQILGVDEKTVCLVDIGIQSSAINIIDQGFLKKSYSFNFNSSQLSQAISYGAQVDPAKAEDIKNREGLEHPRKDMVKTLSVMLDPLLIEIKNICAEFLQLERKEVQEVYLTGGAANLPGLKEYFSKSLNKNVQVPNCFSEFLYPPILEQTLREISPSFAAAVGVALGGFEA